MAFLDNLSQRMIQHSQASAQKTKAMSEISNLNTAISHEDKMIADTYYQIGVEYFNKNKDNPDVPFAGLITAIKAAEQRKAEFLLQIEQIKAIVKCEKCGADIPTGFGLTYCNHCGTPLRTKEAVPDGNYIRCHACGQPLMQDSKFCTGCGIPMANILQHYASASEASHLPDVTDAAAQPEASVQVEAPVQPPRPTCPGCGSFITDEMIFCTGCGTKLK